MRLRGCDLVYKRCWIQKAVMDKLVKGMRDPPGAEEAKGIASVPKF